jgi:hypothetical protein
VNSEAVNALSAAVWMCVMALTALGLLMGVFVY